MIPNKGWHHLCVAGLGDGEREREREKYVHALEGVCACLWMPEVGGKCTLLLSTYYLVPSPLPMIKLPGERKIGKVFILFSLF